MLGGHYVLGGSAASGTTDELRRVIRLVPSGALLSSNAHHGGAGPVQSRSTFPSSSGNRATVVAIRRASSFVRTLACRASASLSRL
jgi:hypothetical protein